MPTLVTSKSGTLGGSPSQQLRLLAVSDDDSQRKDIVATACDAGFTKEQIVEARTEEEAYQRIAHEPFDLAVVDLLLSKGPEKKWEGLRVIERLRESEKSAECRIMAITALTENVPGGEKALRKGANDFICGDWRWISWTALLEQKLSLWKGLLERDG